MRYPLNDTIKVTGAFKDVAMPGTGLKDSSGVARHIGVDFRAIIGTPLVSPANAKVTQSYKADSGNQIIELRVGDKLWRFLHLSERDVKVGQTVKEGQVIGRTGNTGGVAPHLHIDVRKSGTAWDSSLNNYVDPLSLLKPVTQLKEQEMLTQTGAEVLHRFLLGEAPSDYTLKNRVGKMTFDQAYQDIKAQDRYKQHAADVKKAVQELTSHLPVEMR